MDIRRQENHFSSLKDNSFFLYEYIIILQAILKSRIAFFISLNNFCNLKLVNLIVE